MREIRLYGSEGGVPRKRGIPTPINFSLHFLRCFPPADIDSQMRPALSLDCQNWWVNNSLYLSPDAREAFMTVCTSALSHRDFLKGGFTSDKINENWNKVVMAGVMIAQGVDLPPVGEREFLETLK